MSVFPLGGNATHEVASKTMKRFRVAGLGEDVRNVVTRANVVERQGVVNHRMMINVGVCDSKMPEAAKISTTTRDSDTTLIVFVNRGGRGRLRAPKSASRRRRYTHVRAQRLAAISSASVVLFDTARCLLESVKMGQP